MHQPQLYADISRKTYKLRLPDVTKLVDSLTWFGGSTVKVLDVGCGPGDFTAEELLPMLSQRQRCRLVGVDSETSMVSYARDNYSKPGVLSFHQLDIADPDIEATDVWKEMAPFDKIFSYYCLHWVQDKSQTVKNLFKLLSEENGEVILVFVANDGLAEAYRNLSRNYRWGNYMQDYKKYTWAYQDMLDPAKDFRHLMETTGFTVSTCICEKKYYDCKTEMEAKELLSAINPFLNRIPEEDRSEYIQDLLTESLKSKFMSKGQHNESEYIGSGNSLVVKAQKVKV